MRSVKCLRHNEYKNASILERKHLQKNGRKRQQKKHNVSAKDNGIINGRKRQQKKHNVSAKDNGISKRHKKSNKVDNPLDWDCPYCLERGHKSVRSSKCLRFNEYKNASLLERKQLQQKAQKRKHSKRHKRSNKIDNPLDWDCPYCLQRGHKSVRSSKCLQYNTYKNASILEREHLQQKARKRQYKKYSMSVSGKARRKKFGKSKKGIGATKRYRQSKTGIKTKKAYEQSQKGIDTTKRYRQSKTGIKTQKAYEQSQKGINRTNLYRQSKKGITTTNKYEKEFDHRKQYYRYNKNGPDVYHMFGRKFAKYTVGKFAREVTTHVNANNEEVNDMIKTMTDEEILAIKTRWDKHLQKGGNRQVCATCGIVGLVRAKKFKITNKCVDAFKVRVS